MKITWIQPYYDLILNYVPTDTESLVDVGSGYGIFGYIVSKARSLKQLISIEPFDYQTEHYNVCHKMTWEKYNCTISKRVDVIVSTEMIEHLTKANAKLFLHQAKVKAKKVIIATPYYFENQDGYDGNHYQKHKCLVTTGDFITEGYSVRILGVFSIRGLSARIYFHPRWLRYLKIFGVKPTNIIGVYE